MLGNATVSGFAFGFKLHYFSGLIAQALLSLFITSH